MRRTLLLVLVTAVVTSLITSVTVSAATSGNDKAPEGADTAIPVPVEGDLTFDVDLKVNCGTPRPGKNWPNQDALEDSIRCLEAEIINVNKFMKFFLRCGQVATITQYGENPLGGASGYLFDNGDGAGPFLTTALDVTLEGDPFSFFVLWRNSTTCFS
jgi:hypothetical protein